MLAPILLTLVCILYLTLRWSGLPSSSPSHPRHSLFRAVYEELGQLPGLDLKNETNIGLVFRNAENVNPGNFSLPTFPPLPLCVQQFPSESEICVLLSLVLTPSPVWRLCGVELPDRRSVATADLFGSDSRPLIRALAADTPLESEISRAQTRIGRAAEVSGLLGLDDLVSLSDLRWAYTVLHGWGLDGEFSPYAPFFRFSSSPTLASFSGPLGREGADIFGDGRAFMTSAWLFLFRGVVSSEAPIVVSFGRCAQVQLRLDALRDCVVLNGSLC